MHSKIAKKSFLLSLKGECPIARSKNQGGAGRAALFEKERANHRPSPEDLKASRDGHVTNWYRPNECGSRINKKSNRKNVHFAGRESPPLAGRARKESRNVGEGKKVPQCSDPASGRRDNSKVKKKKKNKKKKDHPKIHTQEKICR